MRDDLARAFAFMRRGDLFGTRETRARFGTRVETPELPLRHDSNYLFADVLSEEVTAEELVAEAGKALAIVVPDAAAGERLAPGVAALGWRVGRSLVMALAREPERRADVSLVREVDEAALRPARMASMPPWGRVEVRTQMLDAKREIAARVPTRFFAVLVAGEVASFGDLYCDGETAQIEDVGTLEQHRGRGYASAVVQKAVDEARAGGAGFVFLVTDADDWPQHLYRRLGFEAIGSYWKFTGPPRTIPSAGPVSSDGRTGTARTS